MSFRGYSKEDLKRIKEMFNFLDKNNQGGITIGDGVLIGHNVTLATLNHEENPQKRQNIYPKPIKIGNNVWIGSNATILSGVTIEDGAIIGANALVTKNVPKNTIVAGIPAKIMRKVKLK